MVPNVLADPDSDPSLSDSSLSESFDSSYDNYYKLKQREKRDKKKRQVKTCFNDPIKTFVNLTANLLNTTLKSKVVRFKFYKDTLQCRFYFLSILNPINLLLSNISETYMLLMDYPYIRGEEIPYYA